MITPEDIQRAVSDGICFGASSLGVPVKDTIKVVDGEGYVQGTPNRALMWNVQTPQVFEKAVYQRAMKKRNRREPIILTIASWSSNWEWGFISAWAPMKI